MHSIQLRGARTNNLQNVDLDIEPGTLLVLCGPSGAGKSSLAFGTLYAEGQRRYVESFSAYARQFLERLARPPLDSLEWMPAAIAVDRAGQVKTSRSTVATLTELSDYLKQWWALAAELDCPHCGAKVRAQSPQSAAQALRDRLPERRVIVSYPLPLASEEEFLTAREALIGAGYRRVLVGDEVRDLDGVRPSEAFGAVAQGPKASRKKRGEALPRATTLYVVADRTTTRESDRERLVEALEVAFERGGGRTCVATPEGERLELSRELRCDGCGTTFRKPSPGLFSYNSPLGACEACRGFGRTIGIDWDKVMPDAGKSLREGAIRPWAGKAADHERKLLLRHCKRQGIPFDAPIGELSAAQRSSLVEGDGGDFRNGYPGLRRWFAWLESRAYKMHVRVLLSRFRSYDPCAACGGQRFKPEALAYRVGGLTLAALYAMEASAARAFVARELAAAPPHPPLQRVLQECEVRLQTLCDVGLSYLTLDRAARSLSGGELQRVNLASALDSRLTGTLFVLDEPSIGLHPADVARLLPLVKRLTRGDNIAAVVESDERFIAGADRVIELGPGSGEQGGHVVFDGVPSALLRADTRTGRWLRTASGSGRTRRAGQGELVLRGASGHNLQGLDLRIPLGTFTCVTGVSGSGKSSLVLETLLPALARALGDAVPAGLPFRVLEGSEALGAVVSVDQAPLGRTSRGNVATYLGAWSALRNLFASSPLARERGYKPSTFSFNVAGGRCEACRGEGSETVEMQFLADVRFSCPECGGKRFVGPVLDVRIDGASVADVLEQTAAEATLHFAAHPAVVRCLRPLLEVGAGYFRLGQALSTLSGGEAQRLKLAAALADVPPGCLIALDEPTSGLHGSDIEPLIACLDRLVAAGNSVLVVEHDMRVAAHADHVIDLGPGAGAAGGRIVAAGTPERVAASGASPTSRYLQAALAPQTDARGAAREVLLREPRASEAPLVQVRGAHEHNLKGVDVDIPRDRLVVVTGPSGSGKSSLAFDVVFAESQRRYLETLSPYVRQYLQQLPRPQVDRVDGVPPSVSLEQRQTRGARNSTVATVTEVAHHLRVLYARAGLLHCPQCALPIAPRAVDSLCSDVATRFGKRSVDVFACVVRGQKGGHRELLARAIGDGVTHARIDGEVQALEPGLQLHRYREHVIELLLGRERANAPELRGLLERALSLSGGSASVVCGRDEQLLSSERACPRCGKGFPELDPRFFSFNTRQGACSRCEGSGTIERGEGRRRADVERVVCPDCGGRRLSGLALHTTLDGLTIGALLALSVDEAIERASAVRLPEREQRVAELPLREALVRLRFLQRVGLGYLTLDRSAATLSGGEMQRVRLSGQLGSGLTGVLYVLDEPTIGLHPRDTGRLLAAIRDLVGQGCSVLVVEHDADTIRAADYVIDVGPGGGQGGGHIVARGTPAQLLQDPASVTGRSLARPFALPRRRSVASASWLQVTGVREHNLQRVDLRVPTGRLVAVTGVSGSGKSTLVRDVALRAVRRALGLVSAEPGVHEGVSGLGSLQRAIEIDQSPIGRTPRSVPATYLGVWDEIRKLYASTPDARARGYGASRFSFNVKSGRCAACEGQGTLNVEMSFLPDAQLICEACQGMRFNPETLSVRLLGMHIGEALAADVEQVAHVFAAFPNVRRPLQWMCELGLGYLKLGQPSNTLSGGEAQRLKLIAELATASAAPTLYVMDEPTTGLHREDVARLLTVLDKLVDAGHTVLTIEHHLDVIAHADWVIDLGPEAGRDGGRVIAEGTPEELMRVRQSHTGRALRQELQTHAERDGSPPAERHATH